MTDLAEKAQRLRDELGAPATPEDAARRMVDLSRRTGRTHAMIEALPADGRATVMALSHDHAHHLRQEVVRIRGPEYPVQNLKFTHDGRPNLGIHDPVFVDNALLDFAAIEFVRSLQPPVSR